jgi:hypothetical protein
MKELQCDRNGHSWERLKFFMRLGTSEVLKFCNQTEGKLKGKVRPEVTSVEVKF